MILLIQPVNLGRRSLLLTALGVAICPRIFAADNPPTELEKWNKALSDLDSDYAREIAITCELDFSKTIGTWIDFVKRDSVKDTKFAEGFVQRKDFPVTEGNIKFALDNPSTKYAGGIVTRYDFPLRADLIDFTMQDSAKATIFAKNYTSREDFPKELPLVEETVDFSIKNPNSRLAVELKQNKGYKKAVDRIAKQKKEGKDVKTIDITDDTFHKEVLQSKTPVLVDFWASWCGPCKTVAPRIQAIANDYNGILKVVKLNTDENPNITTQYQVENLPSIILFKDGQPIERIIGAEQKLSIASKIEKHLN